MSPTNPAKRARRATGSPSISPTKLPLPRPHPVARVKSYSSAVDLDEEQGEEEFSEEEGDVSPGTERLDVEALDPQEMKKKEVKREKNRLKQRNLRLRRANHLTKLENDNVTFREECNYLRHSLNTGQQRELTLHRWIQDLESVLFSRGLGAEVEQLRRTWTPTLQRDLEPEPIASSSKRKLRPAVGGHMSSRHPSHTFNDVNAQEPLNVHYIQRSAPAHTPPLRSLPPTSLENVNHGNQRNIMHPGPDQRYAYENQSPAPPGVPYDRLQHRRGSRSLSLLGHVPPNWQTQPGEQQPVASSSSAAIQSASINQAPPAPGPKISDFGGNRLPPIPVLPEPSVDRPRTAPHSNSDSTSPINSVQRPNHNQFRGTSPRSIKIADLVTAQPMIRSEEISSAEMDNLPKLERISPAQGQPADTTRLYDPTASRHSNRLSPILMDRVPSSESRLPDLKQELSISPSVRPFEPLRRSPQPISNTQPPRTTAYWQTSNKSHST